MIRNLLISINNECYEYYEKYQNDLSKLGTNINNILNENKQTVYKYGKITLRRKIGFEHKDMQFSDLDTSYIDNFDVNCDINDIMNYIKTNIKNNDEIYDNMIYIILDKLILLYKISQINECKNLNIKQFRIFTDEVYSCNKCKTISKFVFNVNDFDYNNLHSYCKLDIMPIVNNYTNLNTQLANFENIPYIFLGISKNIVLKLNISLKKYVTNKKFIFSDENKIIEKNDTIYIPFEYQSIINMDEIITKELLKDELLKLNLDWWKDKFNEIKKHKFIGDNCIIYKELSVNNLSLLNYEQYFLENVVNYILHPIKLKNIDIENYNKIKDIFNKEFVKG